MKSCLKFFDNTNSLSIGLVVIMVGVGESGAKVECLIDVKGVDGHVAYMYNVHLILVAAYY